ncbi:hypothetical protein HPB47_002792, partial [Ixodes persulcatus]
MLKLDKRQRLDGPPCSFAATLGKLQHFAARAAVKKPQKQDGGPVGPAAAAAAAARELPFWNPDAEDRFRGRAARCGRSRRRRTCDVALPGRMVQRPTDGRLCRPARPLLPQNTMPQSSSHLRCDTLETVGCDTGFLGTPRVRQRTHSRVFLEHPNSLVSSLLRRVRPNTKANEEDDVALSRAKTTEPGVDNSNTPYKSTFSHTRNLTQTTLTLKGRSTSSRKARGPALANREDGPAVAIGQRRPSRLPRESGGALK